MSAPLRQRQAVATAPGNGLPLVPWADWSTVSQRVNKMWDPRNTPHHSFIGLTGSGKSYLAINGILKPMCPYDRVLIIDSKGDDELVSTTGKGCKNLPRLDRLTWGNPRRREPFDSWWRLDVSDKRAEAQQQVFTALQQVYRGGNWVVLLDEIRDLTDPKPPNLGFGSQIATMYRKGRVKGISILAGTQAPRWVVREFYDQASFGWFGRVGDEQVQKRFTEIGGMGKKFYPTIAELKRREWFLSADGGEYLAKTTVRI